MLNDIPRIPLGDWIDSALKTFVDFSSGTTKALSAVVGTVVNLLEDGLIWVPPWFLIIIFTLISFWATKKWGLPLFTAIGFMLIHNMGFWPAAMSTLSLVIAATVLVILIGIPLGLLAAIFPSFEKIITPVLDVMQTMPSFVYLIPAIPLFGLGKISALFATLIFSVPPAIRMTCLGIKQVPEDLIECADAFGSTRLQRLWQLEFPLAAPTILAGINQAVMLALSMVVVAAMIGARGLGGEVWKAIQRLDVGLGFEAGLGIVIIAIFLDRILNKLGVKASRKATDKS